MSRLTFSKRLLIFCTLSFKNKYPHCPQKGALPVANKKGIITLTLVISRAPRRPTVMRGSFMFGLFKIKTKLQYEIDEYIVYKASKSVFVAEQHKKVLENFTKKMTYKNVSEILLADIQNFYSKVRETTTPFTAINSMQAIRGFMAYFYMKKQHNINPKQITNTGVNEWGLQNVLKNDILLPMIKRRVGRPTNIAFIKKVKRLVDKEGMSLRAIARAENQVPSNIHRVYHYNLDKEFSK